MKDQYNITLSILGETWDVSGDTIEDALNKIDLTWDQVKGKGVLTISKGENKHEHLFNITKLRRIFSNKIVKTHWAKNLEHLLGAGVTTNIPK